MKLNKFVLIGILLILSLACRRKEGPPGPRGPQGPPGPEAFMWETDYFDFRNYNGIYRYIWSFPSDFEVYPEDKVLVYALWEEANINGEIYDVWKPFPITILGEEGIVNYSYDFTPFDVSMEMQATNPNFYYDAELTNDWIVRIVLIPAFWANGARSNIDWNDYEAVKEQFNLPDLPVPEHARRIRQLSE